MAGMPTVILYARVSTEEQARTGFSLAQQIAALRAYAEQEGYEVLEEVVDPGQSGASLERPGMDRVRELVEAGGVSFVLAQDRDRFAREPAYHYLLKREFEERGCLIRALNDRGDGSPEGELTDGILDQLAKFERAKTAERTRRGRMRKAKEGKVLAAHAPRYGFLINEARDGYEVDEERMAVVRRIFRMVAEGTPLRRVKETLEREGVPTPKGAKAWDRSFFRTCVLDDVYKPHSYEEVAALVSAEVARRLDPEGLYGVWWFNRRGGTITQVSEPSPSSPSGKHYRKKYAWRDKPREEWIPVPIPPSGIPRAVVEAARSQVFANRRPPSKAGGREWQLSGGIARCAECGGAASSATRRKEKNGRKHEQHYYRCSARSSGGADACPNPKNVRAEPLEEMAWAFVRDVLTRPEVLEEGMGAMIAKERAAFSGPNGDPGAETRAHLERLAASHRKRARYQEMAAEELISFSDLKDRLATLDASEEATKAALGALETKRERLSSLERDREALASLYAGAVPEKLDALGPEERRSVYRMLGLRVRLDREGRAMADLTVVLGLDPVPLEGVEGQKNTPGSVDSGGSSRSALTAAP